MRKILLIYLFLHRNTGKVVLQCKCSFCLHQEPWGFSIFSLKQLFQSISQALNNRKLSERKYTFQDKWSPIKSYTGQLVYRSNFRIKSSRYALKPKANSYTKKYNLCLISNMIINITNILTTDDVIFIASDTVSDIKNLVSYALSSYR